MSGQMQPQKRFDKGSHNSQKDTYTTNKKVVKLDISSQDSDQSFHPHRRTRDKHKPHPHRNSLTDHSHLKPNHHKPSQLQTQSAKISKKKNNNKAKKYNQSDSSSSITESEQQSGSSLSSKLSNTKNQNAQPNVQPKPKEIQRSRYSYPISKPSQVLIEKPQINDPQLDKAMEQILYKIATEIKPKNKRKYAYDEAIVYDPILHNKAFSRQAFSFKQDEEVKVKQEYFNNPYMPPSLRNSNTQKSATTANFTGSEYEMTLQQLQLRGAVVRSSGRTEKTTATECINDTSDQQVEIVQSRQQKKTKQLELIHWIEQVNRSHKPDKHDQSTNSAHRPEVLFDKHGIQAFLCGLESRR